MKFYLNLYVTLTIFRLASTLAPKIICFYDASSEGREDLAHFTIIDLEIALDFCTHVIYGYAGINAATLQLTSLNTERDLNNRHYIKINSLKDKYPHIKFLLSLGGDKDLENPQKYIQLLKANPEQQKVFIESVLYLLRSYKFDGLDLAYQFPRNLSQEIHQEDKVEDTWKNYRKVFLNKTSVSSDKEDGQYKNLFTNLVHDLKTAFLPHELMLTLTVLPNVNASLYFNATALANNLDFINLLTFDFITPDQQPKEASYSAALYRVPMQGNRKLQHCVEYHVNYWISQRVPRSKLIIGIASYGRSWKMTLDSNNDGFPVVTGTAGPAPAGYLSKTSGLLTWTEICSSLQNVFNMDKTGHEAPLISVLDPHRKFVTYAFRPADENGEHGMWVTYDDPSIAAAKAAYVKRRHLGGVALYDITLDDFHGICNGDKFPMLRYIKYMFL